MNEALKFLKSTLRLPSSKFPPRPPPEALAKYISRCDDLYAWQSRERPADDTFTLHDGPPYANGDLHVGHALNKITKDIICRTKLAQGKRVNYVPGWDCHGLPIELKAFEKNGWERGQGVDPVKIRGAARGFAAKAVEKQMKGFRSWGVMADWAHHWKTMDKEFELRQLTVFKAMVENGLISRRHKPVFWSPSSQTALAEAEIERDWHVSTAALVKFRIPALVGGSAEPVHAVIWTTTPWTLPANQAIAINQNFKYLLVRSKKHGNMIVAHSRLQYLNEQLEEEAEILKVIPGNDLLDCTYSGLSQFGEDALNRPIIHADFVTEEDGTGLVHCAPGHGEDDYYALQEFISSGRVAIKAPVNDKGEYTDAASPAEPSLLAGKYVFDAGNKAVLDLLRSENALVSTYNFKHKYPIDWRTKKPIMIRATAQWFADVSKLKGDVLASLDDVSFIPGTGKSRLQSFVDHRNEWCISRQRAWGVPIPALYHKETNDAVLSSESIEHITNVVRERGIDAWWSDPPNDPAWVMPGLSAEDYVRGTDTMDVWFDSGTSWSLMANLDARNTQTKALANVYFEGSDQHRGWFQSSILTNIAFQKAMNPTTKAYAPFAELVTHGFTLDGQGKKMSKSIGNVVSPEQIIAGLTPQPPKASGKGRVLHPLGPDALRLWAATGDWTSDVTISDKVVTNVHKSLDKYRVTFKVLLGMLSDFNPQKLVGVDRMLDNGFLIHRIALLQLGEVVERVRHLMHNYEFHKALAHINEYLAKSVSSFYLESVKDSIYCDGDALRRDVAQTVLYHIFCQLQHMLGPITPLLIEETYDFTPEAIKDFAGHPHQRVWDPVSEEWLRDIAGWTEFDSHMMQINTCVKAAQERARADKLLGQSLACEVEICLEGYDVNAKDLTPEHMNISNWEDMLVVSKVKISSGNEEVFDQLKALRSAREAEEANQRAVNEVIQRSNATEGNELELSESDAKRREVFWDEEREVLKAAIARQDVNEHEGQAWAFCEWTELESATTEGRALAYVLVRPPSEDKCARCWRYAASKPAGADTPALCGRCQGVVGEIRSDQAKIEENEKKQAHAS
ncbi:isoleucine-tRNA ligase [Neophaeococcomyces mojaviensis]|uniref:Isoleucine-tRNA ligase n=1 Tax=Neophaeococcomyces mojaviensis TaxID=3383035 RepID=A0ACC2ZUN1_9EURO|nr:isoleucine-tRNA ligase [Knufia sp. JES_112]